jgi:hypothetical protein
MCDKLSGSAQRRRKVKEAIFVLDAKKHKTRSILDAIYIQILTRTLSQMEKDLSKVSQDR